MTLLLTSQEENDLPFNYTNHYGGLRIEKNSEIALNHVTINRQRIFKFDTDRVFFISHQHKFPNVPEYMKEINLELVAEPFVLDSEDLIPFVQYPFPVVIPAGSYGMEEFAQQIEGSLNNPTAQYGGDYWVTGKWAVTTLQDADSKEYLGFDYKWDSTLNVVTAAVPTSAEVHPLYDDFADSFDYAAGLLTKKTSTIDGDYDCSVVVERWVSTQKGIVGFDLTATTGACVVGLSRWTDGTSLMPEQGVEFINNISLFEGTTTGGLFEDDGSNFFDYCAFIDDNREISLFQLVVGKFGGNTYSMEKVDYADMSTNSIGTGSSTVVSTNATFFHLRFTIDGEMVQVETAATEKDGSPVFENLSANQFKPINNYTCQMTPKISLSKNNDTVTLLESDFVNPIHVPYRTRAADFSKGTSVFVRDNRGNVDVSKYTNFWALARLTERKEIYDHVTGKFVPSTTKSFMENTFKSFWNFDYIQPDRDSSIAVSLTSDTKYTAIQLGPNNIWWTYLYEVGGTWQYNFQVTDAGLDYIFGTGNYIIPYNLNNDYFTVRGTLNNCMGIPRRFLGSVEHDDGASKKVANIIGNKDLSSTINDILYLRINLGNVLSANGQTNSLSKIISPIIADGELSAGTGVRSYQPEKMYLKLNNLTDIMLDHIKVEIVTANEKYADSLAGFTSASFHVRKSV